MKDEENKQESKKLTLRQLVGSILAGAVGVQSGKNRERDFESGSLLPFVIGGLVFTALFIGSIVLLVNYLLSTS